MTAVRKAKYRFSTLRSRVMHRSASGSQVGELPCRPLESPQASLCSCPGQCISPRLANPYQLQ